MSLTLANVEAALVGYLATKVTVPVSTRVPNPRPASFVRVQRTGGAGQNLVQERPVVLVECWAATDTAAWALAVKAWGALQGREPVSTQRRRPHARQRHRRFVPGQLPDPSTTSARYQFTAELIVNLVKEPTP